MKIGFSFGRCVRDIVKGHVDINDVMCIIARTFMPKEEDVEYVINHYMYEPRYLGGLDYERCLEVGLELWRSGRVVEPRSNGIGAMAVPQDYIWMDLFPTVVDSENESVKSAWEAYRMLIGLTAQLPEYDEHSFRHGPKESAYDPANKHQLTPEEIEEQKKALDLLANCI